MADAFLTRIGLPFPITATNPSTQNFALNQSTDLLSWVFQARESATLTRLGFRYGTRTGTPPTYRISLQGVDASGNPDGTIKGGGSPASATFTPPADTSWNNTWRWVTLSNPYTCARGELLAAVVDYSSGTIDASNFSNLTSYINQLVTTFPYAIENNAGVPSRQNSCCFGYGSSDRVYGYPFLNVGSTLAVNTGRTPDEAGFRLQLPSGWGTTYRIQGVVGHLSIASGHTLRLRIYDESNLVLAETDIDTDQLAATGAIRINQLWFDDAPPLRYGSVYRVTLTPQSATDQTLYWYDVDTNAELDAFPLGKGVYWTERTDAGDWTDRSARRPMLELVLDDTDPGRPAPRTRTNRRRLA